MGVCVCVLSHFKYMRLHKISQTLINKLDLGDLRHLTMGLTARSVAVKDVSNVQYCYIIFMDIVYSNF